jgi:hypothetical protein
MTDRAMVFAPALIRTVTIEPEAAVPARGGALRAGAVGGALTVTRHGSAEAVHKPLGRVRIEDRA